MRLRKCRCSLVITILTANNSFPIKLSPGVVFAGDWCHHQETAPLSLSLLTCGVALCNSCGISDVDTHIADAELNPYPLTLYHLSCIMMGVSCMSPILCVVYRALIKL